jgi:hypothetical protein
MESYKEALYQNKMHRFGYVVLMQKVWNLEPGKLEHIIRLGKGLSSERYWSMEFLLGSPI